MTVCLGWLGAEYFVRNGFVLTVDAAGVRTVTRDDRSYEIGRVCDHPDCPSLVTVPTPAERQAA